MSFGARSLLHASGDIFMSLEVAKGAKGYFQEKGVAPGARRWSKEAGGTLRSQLLESGFMNYLQELRWRLQKAGEEEVTLGARRWLQESRGVIRSQEVVSESQEEASGGRKGLHESRVAFEIQGVTKGTQEQS